MAEPGVAMCPIAFRVAMQRGEVTPGQSDTSNLGAVPSGATPDPAQFYVARGSAFLVPSLLLMKEGNHGVLS